MDSGMDFITERYCHVVGHNVAVEQSVTGGKTVCLNEHACRSERGGCTNKLFVSQKP